MGAVVQNRNPSVLGSLYQQKQQPISLTHFENTRILPNGLIVIRMQSGEPGLFYTKEITTSAEKEALLKWAQMNCQHTCNVVKYEVETLSMFCSTHMQLKAILEYGHQNLAETLHCKESNWSTMLDRSRTTITEKAGNTSLEILTLIKFLIEAVEEHKTISNQWITFHTTNVVYMKEEKKFKYLYLPSDGVFDQEVFYDPYSLQQGFMASEATTVFSLGMLLMSLLLREDCSDCYNYQNFSFCWSIFQEKKDKMKEQLLEKSVQNLSFSTLQSPFEEEIISLTLSAISSDSRASFQEIKTMYYGILRKIVSSSHQGRSQLRKGRGKKGSHPAAQMQKKYTMQNSSQTPNKENRNHSNYHCGARDSLFLNQQFKMEEKASEVRERGEVFEEKNLFRGLLAKPISPILKKRSVSRFNI